MSITSARRTPPTETTFTLTDLANIPPTRTEAVALLWDVLPKLWANLPKHETREEEIIHNHQATRIVASILHRDACYTDVENAMQACRMLHSLEAGDCLVHLLGEDSTGANRTRWIDIYHQQLADSIRELTGAIPERAYGSKHPHIVWPES